MSASKLITGISVVLIVAGMGFAAWQARQTARMRAAVADERTAWRERLWRLDQRIAELESREPVAPAVAAGQDAPEAGGAEALRLQQDRLAAERRFHQDLARRRAQQAKAAAAAHEAFVFSPETQKRNFRHFQLSLPSRYRSLYRRLGLSDSQIQEFERLQAERYWITSDLMAARRQQGAPAGLTPSDFNALNAEALGPIDQQLRTVLGESGFQDYEHFEDSVPVDTLVELLAGKFAGAAEPLSRAQWDQLAAVFATHNHKRDSWNRSWLAAEIMGSTAPGASWRDLAWEPAVQQLQTVLTPSQLTVLQAIREQTELRLEAAALRDTQVEEMPSRSETAPPVVPPAQ